MKTFISIITVNYNGKKLLKRFLDSVFAVDYPKENYEVIVVDNASTDGSRDFIKKHYKSVKLVVSKKNLGFGGGNNLGINESKGDLIFLVNNDTYVCRESVKNAVKCFITNKKSKVGAITSKLVLIDRYLKLTLIGAGFSDYYIKDLQARPINKKPYIRNYMQDKSFTQSIYLPFSHFAKNNLEINIVIAKSDTSKYKINLNGKLYKKGAFSKKETKKKIHIKLNRDYINNYSVDLIQNAGNFYFRDGAGRDRGVYIVGNKQYYESDKGQYDKKEYVPGFNGAGVFLNRKTINTIGKFDEHFFMYYEDGDLSHRMKKAGWEILYCPKAKIRHIHSASSVEWSDFFIYHTERNRLVMVFKHWPLLASLRLWILYIFKETLGTTLYYFVKGENDLALQRLKTRLRINLSLANCFIRFLPISNRYTYEEINSFL